MSKAAETREKIEVALLNLAAGQQKVTVATVCKKAGVTPPTFYHYFSSLAALLDFVREETNREIFSALQGHPAGKTSFETIADDMLPILYKNRFRLRILYTSGLDFEWWEHAEQRYVEWLRPYYAGAGERYGLSDDFLLRYIARSVVTVISLWLTDELPEKPAQFKSRFLLLLNTPLSQLINEQRAIYEWEHGKNSGNF